MKAMELQTLMQALKFHEVGQDLLKSFENEFFYSVVSSDLDFIPSKNDFDLSQFGYLQFNDISAEFSEIKGFKICDNLAVEFQVNLRDRNKKPFKLTDPKALSIMLDDSEGKVDITQTSEDLKCKVSLSEAVKHIYMLTLCFVENIFPNLLC